MDESSSTLELEDAVDDFMAMYVAGTATTNTTLLWSLGMLTRRPDVMEKLLDEVFFCSAVESTALVKSALRAEI